MPRTGKREELGARGELGITNGLARLKSRNPQRERRTADRAPGTGDGWRWLRWAWKLAGGVLQKEIWLGLRLRFGKIGPATTTNNRRAPAGRRRLFGRGLPPSVEGRRRRFVSSVWRSFSVSIPVLWCSSRPPLHPSPSLAESLSCRGVLQSRCVIFRRYGVRSTDTATREMERERARSQMSGPAFQSELLHLIVDSVPSLARTGCDSNAAAALVPVSQACVGVASVAHFPIHHPPQVVLFNGHETRTKKELCVGCSNPWILMCLLGVSACLPPSRSPTGHCLSSASPIPGGERGSYPIALPLRTPLMWFSLACLHHAFCDCDVASQRFSLLDIRYSLRCRIGMG